MLRITVHNHAQGVTLQLEGHMAAPWLQALDECWRDIFASRREPVVSVDLTGVTLIDGAGKAFLAAMARQGASFVAADCLTRDIVDEITRPPLPDRTSPGSRG
jgi:ABC-type transporter Mla MlaB component